MSTSDKAQRSRARTVRWVALLVILAISTVLGILHQHYRDGLFFVVGVDALCPFGGVEVLWSYMTSGTFIKRTAASSLILLVGSLAAALMMSRSFCGQICPLGTLQEAFGRLGIHLTGRRLTMPAALDKPARYLKYVVLVVFTWLTWQTATLVIRPYDPWAAYHHLTSTEVFSQFAIGLIVLVISLGASMFYDRFFCKYLCPMGALLALISRISWFRIRRAETTCTDCKLCDRSCPVNIEVSARETVRDAECIACNECVNACPVSDTLEISDGTGRVVRPVLITILTLSIFFGVVAVTTAVDAFEWTKQPGRGGQGQGGGQEGHEDGTESHGEQGGSGQGADQEIRGKTTMNEVATMTGIPAVQLQTEFGLSTADMGIPLKDIKDDYGFSMNDVRAYVAAEAP